MINTKELRVGNLVMVHGRYIGKVESVAAEGINGVPSGDFDMDYYVAEGIPLTDEWLGRMGFIQGKGETDRNVFYATGVHSGIHSISLSGGIMLERAGSKMMLERHVEYVHQLQNLYFALTGEELQLQ